MLFQGEEWAASSPFQFFTNHNPELGKLVSAGRRKEFAAFGWNPADIPDPQSPATFQRSNSTGTSAANPLTPQCSTGTAASSPCALHPRPYRSRPRTHPCPFQRDDHWLVMERGSVTIAFSLAPQPIQLEVQPGSTIALGSSPEIQINNNSLTLPPDTVAVLTSE